MGLYFTFLFFSYSCTTTDKTTDIKPDKDKQYFYPGGKEETILNEKGEVVQISNEDPEFFQKTSKDWRELFRVIISSEGYQVRQIRKSEWIKRAPDEGGDKLTMEELKPYNKVDYVDDGVVAIELSPYTGKIQNLNFDTRVPRINELAKIVQNDATRWKLIHKNEDEPSILEYKIFYQIKLQKNASREEVIDLLKKKK